MPRHLCPPVLLQQVGLSRPTPPGESVCTEMSMYWTVNLAVSNTIKATVRKYLVYYASFLQRTWIKPFRFETAARSQSFSPRLWVIQTSRDGVWRHKALTVPYDCILYFFKNICIYANCSVSGLLPTMERPRKGLSSKSANSDYWNGAPLWATALQKVLVVKLSNISHHCWEKRDAPLKSFQPTGISVGDFQKQ